MRISKTLVGVATATVGFSMAGCGGTQATDMSGYNNRTLDSSTSTPVSSGTSFGAATLGSKLLLLQGKPSFIVGMNLSTLGGQPGRELGKNPFEPEAEATYNPKNVNASLQDIAGAGCNVIRLNLFTKLDGLKIDSDGLVSGLDDTFVKNLSDVLAKAETDKVQVYISLPGSWSGQAKAKNPISVVAANGAYLKKAITPLIGKLKGRSGIVAIDVADEIEADIAGKEGNTTKTGATWDEARAFIKATVEVIKSVDPQRLVSCGSGLHGWQNLKDGKYSKLGLDFYDFHVYDDKGNLPAAKDLKLDRPVLVGSCGQLSTKVDNDIQAKADIAFLTNAQKQGYAGALTEYNKDPESAQSLFDKQGKHRPVYAQLQSFVAALAMNATGTSATSSSTLGVGK